MQGGGDKGRKRGRFSAGLHSSLQASRATAIIGMHLHEVSRRQRGWLKLINLRLKCRGLNETSYRPLLASLGIAFQMLQKSKLRARKVYEIFFPLIFQFASVSLVLREVAEVEVEVRNAAATSIIVVIGENKMTAKDMSVTKVRFHL
ncbi:hypothetical protein C8J57DRAFT_1223923 [Mycena rebaudengoi]|nr:hypothetical protein C8J57DRAFT_1223923 [Mycena rebaudengoi]